MDKFSSKRHRANLRDLADVDGHACLNETGADTREDSGSKIHPPVCRDEFEYDTLRIS
jgi:hypothetical protein